MVESFKITAQKLKRILKVSVDLPDEYNHTEENYPLILSLDGQFLYNFLLEDTKKLEVKNVFHTINKPFICIALHSPKIEEWRQSELNPYYNGKNKLVDTVLAHIYYEYIATELIPLLKERYRFNDEIYLIGFEESSIACLYMTYAYSIFKGCGLFYPKMEECNQKIWSDLERHFTCKKIIYMYQGGKNTETSSDDNFYKLCLRMDSLKCEILKYDYNEHEENSFETYEKHLNECIQFLLENNGN